MPTVVLIKSFLCLSQGATRTREHAPSLCVPRPRVVPTRSFLCSRISSQRSPEAPVLVASSARACPLREHVTTGEEGVVQPRQA